MVRFCRLLIMLVATSIAVISVAAFPPLQKVSSGKVDRVNIYSNELEDTITVDVWTPENYDADRKEGYPVIYMHDGQNLFDNTTTFNHQSWEMDSVTDNLINRGLIEAPVIVGIHSRPETRIGYLMPEKALRMIENLPDSLDFYGMPIIVKGDKYASFIVNELKPLMENAYNLSSRKDETIIMGSSMGGLMSAYVISEYPDVFGGAGCLSTHWIGDPERQWALTDAILRYLDMYLPSPADHKLYFDHGTQGIDAYYGDAETLVLELAKCKGYVEGESLMSYFADGDDHQERYWMNRVWRPLTFLLPKKK